jgi:hypothetical protein
VVDTKIYTDTKYDLPIEDRVREYEKDFVLNIEAIQNFEEMIATLRQEYIRIFSTVRKINNKIKKAVFKDDETVSIEDFDEVVVMCKAIVTKSNPHKNIMNQIIVSFSERRPKAKYFYHLFNEKELSDRIDQKRYDSAAYDTEHDKIIHEELVPQLREDYFNIVKEAIESEKIFDFFGFQTDTLRKWPGSEHAHPEEIRAGVRELKQVAPILIRFADAFEDNFVKLIKHLVQLQSMHGKLFDVAAKLETLLTAMSWDWHAVHWRRSSNAARGIGNFEKNSDKYRKTERLI